MNKENLLLELLLLAAMKHYFLNSLLKGGIIAFKKELIFVTSVDATNIMLWNSFKNKHPQVATMFNQAQKDAQSKEFWLSGSFGVHSYLPKKENSTNEHRSDIVTYWEPSQLLMNEFIKTGTLVNQNKMEEPQKILLKASTSKQAANTSRIIINTNNATMENLVTAAYYQTRNPAYKSTSSLVNSINNGNLLEIDSNL